MMAEAPKPALAGLRVLDATKDVAGQFCGRLFADYGAEVMLAEPAEGSPTRCAWPLEPGGGAEASFLFRHLNQGKKGCRLPADVAEAASALSALAQDADVVLISAGEEALKATLDETRQ